MSRLAAYCRVSTTDKQTTKSQREAIRNWAKSTHVRLEDLVWYEDKKTGANIDRPALKKMLRDIDRQKIDGVILYKLDRLSRSLSDGITMLGQLADKGIRVVSVSENIDFSNSVGRLIASVLFATACFSREQTVERIVAGMNARRAANLPIGRPQNTKRLQMIRRLFDGGMSAVDIGLKLNCTRANVYASLDKTKDQTKKAG